MAAVIPFEERAVARLRDRLGAAEEANQDLGRKVIIVVDEPDIGDQLHAVEPDIVMAADERRNEGRSGLGREQRLRGGKAERHVDHCSVA